jgi:hypothetical protein
MTTTQTHTGTHVYVGFANPYLICEKKICKKKVPYWHDPDRCRGSCDQIAFNHPCGHELGTTSTCPTWSPVEGCMCPETCKK